MDWLPSNPHLYLFAEPFSQRGIGLASSGDYPDGVKILVRGDGVAARCCAHLLTNAGFAVAIQPTARRRLPVIMLSETALELIRDVFHKPDLFRDAPRIKSRVVAWGPEAAPVTLPHSAVVVSEELLLQNLCVEVLPCESERPHWTIFGSPPLPAEIVEHRFGSRRAFAAEVELAADSDRAACHVESVENGWLFLVSDWLLSVGGPPESLLSQSRVIAPQIRGLIRVAADFPSSPRIAAPFCGTAWITCGTAAIAFDPICGDGTANAIREAILASAVLRAIANGAAAESVCTHYETRLTAGFERHLVNCLQFYRSGNSGPWWRAQAELTGQGIEWCRGRLSRHPEFRYRLSGYELYPIGKR